MTATGVVAVPGAKIVYDLAGEAEPALLFLHGGGCCRADWRPQLEALSDSFRVVAPDLRGHGDSEVDDPASCTIDEMAADVHRVLDALAIRDAVVVGHSFGCRVALQAAAGAPGGISGVVLVDGSRVWTGALEAVDRRQAGQFADVRSHYTQIIVQPAFFVHADGTTRGRIRDSMLSTPEPVLRAIGLSTGPWDAQRVEGVIASLNAPLLAIQSTYWSDSEVRRSLSPGEDSTPWLDLLRRHAPSVAVEIVPHIGHFAMIEAPDVVNASIRSFRLTTATARRAGTDR